MLDYSSMEVLNSNSGYFPVSGILIWLILIAGIMFGVYIGKVSGKILYGIFFGACLCLILTFLGMISGDVDNSSLVRFEVTEVQMSEDVYPAERKRNYLKKEGDKIYYYDLIKNGIVNNPYEIKKATEEKFKELVFNIENQRKK